jgi:predicted  nucleic acid-binding Zn-ribbon protein
MNWKCLDCGEFFSVNDDMGVNKCSKCGSNAITRQ